MRKVLFGLAFLSGSVFCAPAIFAGDDPAPARRHHPSPSRKALEPMRLDLLEGLRTGQLAARAVGTGGPAMDLKVTNRTGRNLRVVLPPGLIAAGATASSAVVWAAWVAWAAAWAVWAAE